MTLEDFFTLSEMKDGLAALNRVEELLSVMQNQDSNKGLVGDAARQWTTVANILAITENKDCLDHFLKLNGLSFLSNWLHEAQKCGDDNTDCSMEELISALLRALDRLPVDKEMLSPSGVGVTVEQLHGHLSQSIQDKAKTLCDKWKHMEDNDSEHRTVDETSPACDDGNKRSTETISAEDLKSDAVLENSLCDKVSDENAKTCSSSSPVDICEDVKVSSNQIALNSSERNEVSGEMNTVTSSCMVNPCEESLPVKESVCPEAGVASASPCGSPVSRGKNVDEPSDVSDGKDTSDGPQDMDIEVNMKEVSPCKSSEKEMCFSSAEACFHKGDIGRTSIKGGDGDLISKVDKGVDSKISSALRSPVNANTVSESDQRRSEIGLEYGEIDALEVARQVAIEVEREVVDYREPFCSSPEVISRGEIMDSCSSDLQENKNEKAVGEQLSGNESPTRKTHSVNSSPRNSTRITEDVDVKNSVPRPESQKSTSVLESACNMDKNNKCEFDLNEDVCSQENDSQMVPTANQTINMSGPIHVAASKGAPSLPVTPLHFEGELGWRGSAATSAFRPASPRRTSDGEKTAYGSKQKINFLKIDLNVTEGEDDVAIEHPSNKRNPPSSCISLDKSSTETSSRVERLELDLNRIGDEDTLPNQLSHWRPSSHQNGNCSSSPASSSSSRQPSMRDFDLNDNPSFFDACGSSTLGKFSSQDTSTYASRKFDDPVITIMGSRMSIERKEPVNQALRPFLGNGLGMDSAIRASSPYPPLPPHAYGYHGLQMGPAMPILPALYGPGSIPYMVDSRGVTVIPQILGSPGLGSAAPTRPPFLMGVPGAPAGLNLVGSVPRPSLDLNAGTTPAEGGNKEIGSFKQFFMQGNSGLTEEHVTSASQPAVPGMVLKRKEPDCGWEPYPFGPGYKQATSWQ
ncbi:hypothetical protein Taro_025600 [Colocasia esculenta]|uniref:TFIIS N-terminal domain-containing protein n=1 Tax=Colocasia esculenta TaxID=4460 RepID=A0A843VAM3_COLES|nr:hypothetical protein [Colocasia esculenta]